MTKREIRKKLSEERNKLSKEDSIFLSEKVFHNIMSMDLLNSEKKVFAFVSTKSEISTNIIISYCFENGILVAVPKVYGNVMKFHVISSFDDLKEGAYGILEPDYELPVVKPDKNSIILMPGLAFDLQRGRIGYGGGYYDKYFEKNNQGLKLGICFDFQVLKNERLPMEESDIKPDMIITDKSIYGGIYE